MKTLRTLALLSLAVAALSCVKEQHPRVRPEIYHKSDVEVKATASLPEGWTPITKAVSDITDIDNTELQTNGTGHSNGFGVYAFYTGAEEYSSATNSSEYDNFGLVLNNRHFNYNGSNWVNTGEAEFWPTKDGENLSLFAYAPWDTWNDKVVYDGTVPYIVYDNYVAQDLSVAQLSKQRDILWGTNTSGNPHKNVEKDDYDPEGTVDFHFRHAVAKVHFAVKGSLPGESRGEPAGGTRSTDPANLNTVTPGEAENGEIEPIDPVESQITVTGSSKNWTATQTLTEKKKQLQTRYRTYAEIITGATSHTQGQRYLVETVTMKGFNRTGTLVLDNESAYTPTWTNVSKFQGSDPEYVLNSGNILSQSLQYAPAATVQSNFGTYTGITEDATDLMSDYFLYSIPRSSSNGDRIAVTIKYHKLAVNGTVSATMRREVVQYQQRTIEQTRTKTRTARNTTSKKQPAANSFTMPSWESVQWSQWSQWSTPDWGAWTDDSYGAWTTVSETLTSATVNYEGAPINLSGEVITSLLGGRAYTINLIVAGDKMELDVIPQPWDLKEFDFDYNANINDVIQALTYDSSYIDYADADGNVYINNRMGKFYFKLGAGKYASWQASLVGDAAFGFTDENGNWILDDHGNRVASIRGAIDPEVMNYLYIKPIDTEATVTSHAKLRIYYIDATGDAVVALNLVNLQGVTEWTIWQNAN